MKDPLDQPRGFAELGMWLDAWEAVEDLPPAIRATKEALRIRVACTAHLDRWDMGQVLVALLEQGGDEDREVAAQFYHSLAAHHMERGEIDAAKDAVRKAIRAWPDIKLAILENLALDGIW